jgi:hypothetical protein
MERSSITPMRVRASVSSSFIINSTTMFSYPPRPWIQTRDNLVSVLPGSPAMPPVVGTSLGMETAITMEYVAMRLDR